MDLNKSSGPKLGVHDGRVTQLVHNRIFGIGSFPKMEIQALNPKYIVAIDFEALGGNVNLHSFSEMGASLINLNTGIEESFFLENVNLTYQTTMETRCLEEFWSKHPETLCAILIACSKSTHSSRSCIQAFWDWVQGHVKSGKHIDRIVTDNCGFDGAILANFTAGSALYSIDGTYREITDTGNYYAGLLRAPFDNDNGTWRRLVEKEGWTLPDFGVTHTHRANDDAKLIGLKYAFVQKMLKTKSNIVATP
mgnify:CR=1 FL=1